MGHFPQSIPKDLMNVISTESWHCLSLDVEFSFWNRRNGEPVEPAAKMVQKCTRNNNRECIYRSATHHMLAVNILIAMPTFNYCVVVLDKYDSITDTGYLHTHRKVTAPLSLSSNLTKKLLLFQLHLINMATAVTPAPEREADDSMRIMRVMISSQGIEASRRRAAAPNVHGRIIIGLEELLVVGRLLTAFLVSFLASFLASFVFFVHDGHADWWPLSVILAIAVVWYSFSDRSEDEDVLHKLITEMLRAFLVCFLIEFVSIVYIGHAKWWPLWNYTIR